MAKKGRLLSYNTTCYATRLRKRTAVTNATAGNIYDEGVSDFGHLTTNLALYRVFQQSFAATFSLLPCCERQTQSFTYGRVFFSPCFGYGGNYWRYLRSFRGCSCG